MGLSSPGKAEWKTTYDNFIQRQGYIINITDLHLCRTSYAHCQDRSNLNLGEKKRNIS